MVCRVLSLRGTWWTMGLGTGSSLALGALTGPARTPSSRSGDPLPQRGAALPKMAYFTHDEWERFRYTDRQRATHLTTLDRLVRPAPSHAASKPRGAFSGLLLLVVRLPKGGVLFAALS